MFQNAGGQDFSIEYFSIEEVVVALYSVFIPSCFTFWRKMLKQMQKTIAVSHFSQKRNLLKYVCLKDFLINESLYYLAKMFMIFYFQHQLVSVNPMETTTTYCCYIARQHGAKKENLSLNQNTCGLTKGSKKCKRWVAFFLQK